MKTIYILLTKSDTVLSRIIHFITMDSYTHVSISFEESLQPLYSSSRKNGRTIFPAGPCMEQLCCGYYREHASRIPCALYELQVDEDTWWQAKKEAQRIIENAEEYHYNIFGLLLCQFNIPYHRKRHYFCSQFVSDVLDKSSALKLPKDASLMKPSDYMSLPELSYLYHGQLRELVMRQTTAAAI